jgi:hypothetical protein
MLPAFAQVGLMIHEIVCSRSAEVRRGSQGAGIAEIDHLDRCADWKRHRAGGSDDGRQITWRPVICRDPHLVTNAVLARQ